MAGKVLITGGSGLIGSRLTELLQQQGYAVAHLSRHIGEAPADVAVYEWDIARSKLDEQAFQDTDYLIHLAGAGIADQRWTTARKKELLDSRTQSIHLLASTLKKIRHRLKAFVSSSAIGLYGADTGEQVITEATPPGRDFLGQLTHRWEIAANEIAELGIRTVKLRTGIVLSEKGGALAKLVQPIRLGAGTILGSGNQYVSWLHVDDMAKMYQYALETESMQGAYNAVAPKPITHAALIQAAAQVLNKPLWLPHVPAFALKLALGEMAIVVLGGNYVTNERLVRETDFVYQFPDIRSALRDLLGK